jgi:hypothetical protein
VWAGGGILGRNSRRRAQLLDELPRIQQTQSQGRIDVGPINLLKSLVVEKARGVLREIKLSLLDLLPELPVPHKHIVRSRNAIQSSLVVINQIPSLQIVNANARTLCFDGQARLVERRQAPEEPLKGPLQAAHDAGTRANKRLFTTDQPMSCM